MADKNENYVYLLPGRKCKPGRVCLLEEDDRHPQIGEGAEANHRVMVVGGMTEAVQAAQTEAVTFKIGKHELRLVEGSGSSAAPVAEEADNGSTNFSGMSRAELNAHAESLGIDDPEGYPNKDALVAAINDAQD